jgi:hypothetical protein
MNIGPKWRMMDHKWAGECALRASGLPYSIVRPGALWLTGDGSGGSSGRAFVVRASQGERPLRGRIARSDLAAVLATCVLDCEAARDATFDIAQVEPAVPLPYIDDGTRWAGLRKLVSDADAEAPPAHAAWLGLFGLQVSVPARREGADVAAAAEEQAGDAEEQEGDAEEAPQAEEEAAPAAEGDGDAA